MKFIPYEVFYLSWLCTVEHSRNVLLSLCGLQNAPASATRSNSEFVCSSKTEKIKLYRNITYRNSFLPIAIISILEESKISKIKIKLRMTILANLFMILWVIATFLMGALALITVNFQVAAVPFLMCICGYMFMQILFLFEASKIKKILTNIKVS